MASHISGYSTTSSAMYQSTLASTGIHHETFSDRMTQTKNWLYNGEDGTVMGRTPTDWFIYIICIVVFLTALMCMSAAFCAIFYWAIDWNYPSLKGAASILQTPGMSFRPQPDVTSTLIRFVKGDGSTYVHYLDHMEAYIQYYEYELQQGDNYEDCRSIKTRRLKDLNKVCMFELTDNLGRDCVKQQNYGYDDGQPCVLLKMNRIFNWIPEEFTNDTVPNVIRNIWNINDPWWVIVRCDGDDAVTRENMGDLTYYPPGFHFKYFPFLNQQGYRSPVMFLRFQNPTPGVLLMVTCRAFARNIVQDHVEKVGQVHFEVLVD